MKASLERANKVAEYCALAGLKTRRERAVVSDFVDQILRRLFSLYFCFRSSQSDEFSIRTQPQNNFRMLHLLNMVTNAIMHPLKMQSRKSLLHVYFNAYSWGFGAMLGTITSRSIAYYIALTVYENCRRHELPLCLFCMFLLIPFIGPLSRSKGKIQMHTVRV